MCDFKGVKKQWAGQCKMLLFCVKTIRRRRWRSKKNILVVWQANNRLLWRVANASAAYDNTVTKLGQLYL